MVQRFVEVVLPLPLMVRLVGGNSEVWMDIGVLRRTERGLEVEWTLPGRVFEPAWKSSSPHERATEARQWIEFAVRTDLGPRAVAWCAVTGELERLIREQVAALRGSKFRDAKV